MAQEEAERLTDILVRFPTSEQEDAALLESGKITDWRARKIIEFRMLRKRVTYSPLHSPSHLLC